MNSFSHMMVDLLMLIVAGGGMLEDWHSYPTSGASRDGDQHFVAACQASRKETKKKMDIVFEKAVVSHGQDYLDAEQTLRNGGATAVATLRKYLKHPDPVAQIMAKCLLDWIEGRAPDYQAALDYLDNLPQRLARTPITSPSPSGIAAYLDLHFGPRVADFLALRLVKGSDWPHWRVAGVLLYLSNQRLPSTTAALIRFAAEINNDEWRSVAIKTIKAAQDPALRAKIAAERKRVEQQNKVFPKALADLGSP